MTTVFWLFVGAVILASVAAFFTPRLSLSTLLKLGVGFVIIGVVVVALTFLRRPSLEEATRIDCVINLKQIDGAKEQVAIEKKVVRGGEVDGSAVDALIKGGRPKCRGHGTYRYGNVGERPICSLPSHKLP